MPVTGVERMPKEWLEQIYGRLMRFEDVWTPDDLDLPYTREGLERFEAWLLEQWPTQDSFVSGNDADFVECASAYIGEVYLRAYGGGWYIDPNPNSMFYGPPAVCLDTEDRTPIQPYYSMTSLLKRRTGRELVKVYDAQGRRIEARRATEPPGWRPLREPIPDVTTPDDVGAPPTAERLEWELGIPDRLAALNKRVGPEAAAQLDLSPESFDVLAPLVVADFATEADLDTAAADQDPRFAEHLTYIGETMLRAGGGHWVVWPASAVSADNVLGGQPHVTRYSPANEWVFEWPQLAMTGLVRGRPGDLRRRFDLFLRDRA
jgi:hypothetical protein